MLSSRRDLLIAALAALPLTLAARGDAEASPIDPTQTAITLPSQMQWVASPNAVPHSVESATLYGSPEKPGPYVQLVRWYPGFMSAPHQYDTDRLCVVLSGVWWCNSGSDFDAANTQPAVAGSFVHRFAHTWHYDGVKGDGKEPATIAIYGVGPVNVKWFNGVSTTQRV